MWLQLLYIAAALVLILLNAFFVLAEFAIVKVRTTRLRELSEAGDRRASIALDIVQRLDAYLSACQLGITVASLGLGWIGEPAFARLLEPVLGRIGVTDPRLIHSVAFAVGFSIITLLHIVLGELAPKSLAIRRADRAALRVARPLRWFYLLSFPAMWVLNSTSNLVLRALRIPMASEMERAYSHEELKMLLGASLEQGVFTLSRLLMMENVLDFGTLKVENVDIHADKVVLLDPAKPWAENLEVIRKRRFSRYPLKEPKIRRVVHIKDIALRLASGEPMDLLAVARKVHAVAPSMSLEELLKHFTTTNTHMAIVEEAERFIGIVTLEDVIEELIGTVRDEFEKVIDHRLTEIVPRNGVVLGLEARDKESAIRELASRLAASRADLDAGLAVTEIMRREKLASTGLGDGIAIPHGRVSGLQRPTAALGVSREGVEFQSLDGKPARLIFLVLTPPQDEGAHVHILERISTLLSSDYLREQLLHAQDIDDVFQTFRMSDKSLSA